MLVWAGRDLDDVGQAVGVVAGAKEMLLQAGQLAAARSANVEAVAHLSVGLASISDLVASSRPRWELSLQLALGGPLIATKGFASSEVEAAYLRAQYLSQELGQDTDLFTEVPIVT